QKPRRLRALRGGARRGRGRQRQVAEIERRVAQLTRSERPAGCAHDAAALRPAEVLPLPEAQELKPPGRQPSERWYDSELVEIGAELAALPHLREQPAERGVGGCGP